MTLFIYDEIWEELTVPTPVRRLLSSADVTLPVTASCTLEQVEQVSKITRQHESVYGFGGGSVLDKVKLALWNEEEPIRPYASRGRVGIATIPSRQPDGVTLIPTTLGTGSEANAKAILQVSPHRRRLIMCRHGKAFAYQHIPSVYANLKKQQIAHGVLEIVLRTAGIASISTGVAATLFTDMFHEAAECALQVHETERAGEHYQLMANVAELSARTHRTDLPTQQKVWVWPLWYLANELSSIAAVTKLEASIALMNPVMSRIGSFGCGSKAALVSLEKEIGESLTDFITRIGEPLDAKVAKRIANVDMDLLVPQTLSQWGGGALPLGNVSRAVIQEIFAEAASQYA